MAIRKLSDNERINDKLDSQIIELKGNPKGLIYSSGGLFSPTRFKGFLERPNGEYVDFESNGGFWGLHKLEIEEQASIAKLSKETGTPLVMQGKIKGYPGNPYLVIYGVKCNTHSSCAFEEDDC